MRGRGPAAVLCSLLFVFEPALAAPPASAVGTVSGWGLTQVNGALAPAGTVVYSGNRIETGPKATAFVMVSGGGKFVLGPSTAAQLGAAHTAIPIRLCDGMLGVVSRAQTPIVVETGGVTVRAKDAAGTYMVTLEGRSLRVVARAGTALAEAANRTIEIPAGTMMRAKLATAKAGAKKNRLETVLLVAGVGAAAGLGLAITGLSGSHSRNCASPTQLACP